MDAGSASWKTSRCAGEPGQEQEDGLCCISSVGSIASCPLSALQWRAAGIGPRSRHLGAFSLTEILTVGLVVGCCDLWDL